MAFLLFYRYKYLQIYGSLILFIFLWINKSQKNKNHHNPTLKWMYPFKTQKPKNKFLINLLHKEILGLRSFKIKSDSRNYPIPAKLKVIKHKWEKNKHKFQPSIVKSARKHGKNSKNRFQFKRLRKDSYKLWKKKPLCLDYSVLM